MLRLVVPVAVVGAFVATCAVQLDARGEEVDPTWSSVGDEVFEEVGDLVDSDTTVVGADEVVVSALTNVDTDTDPIKNWSAARLAGEEGGLHCSSAGGASALWLWSPLLLLLLRRRR